MIISKRYEVWFKREPDVRKISLLTTFRMFPSCGLVAGDKRKRTVAEREIFILLYLLRVCVLVFCECEMRKKVE